MREYIKNLHPASFAAVMATGIISIAFKQLGYNFMAIPLFVLNSVLYSVLFCLLAARVSMFPTNFSNDLKHPKKGFALLTLIAGTNTFGMELVSFNFIGLAKILWGIGLVCWLILLYSILINLIAYKSEPIEKVVDGTTLLIVVSTQSVALLGSTLAGTFGTNSQLTLFLSWAFWASGFILYLIIITLVSYRLIFKTIEPKDWTGPYWICMGAAAITTLAGATLVTKFTSSTNWQDLIIFTKGITLMTWAIGSWWIPILLFMDVWSFSRSDSDISPKPPIWLKAFPWLRLAFNKFNSYDTPSWGRVFPLGMYTVCTIALVKITPFGFLIVIPKYWGWFALAIWSLTFIGAIRSIAGMFSKNLFHNSISEN